MTEVDGVPALLDSLFAQFTQTFEQAEAADVIHDLKRLYPARKDSFDQTDLYGALKQLFVLGAIDDEENQKLLEILAKKASKKDQILDLISGYKEASSPPRDDFVGRDNDLEYIVKLLTNSRVPGINLLGDSGVGKTTLAKEVSKRMESLDDVFIDLREIKCLNTVYFNILQALHLPFWGDNKKERIYNHLASLNRKTVIILDSIEQLLSRENQEEQETRADFLEFLNVIVCSEASKNGCLKIILTSITQLNEAALKSKMFAEYIVQPFSKDFSKDFISKRNRGDFSDVQQDKAMYEIAQLCRNNPYLLQGAQQLMRESFATPTDVLQKITARVEKKVPEEFACISALFESLPSDHLRGVAVKISLLRRPFSLSTAMKIADVSSDYDAELDLEMLATHKIITAKDVNRKRKYDLHALFRDFVASHLCKENHVLKEHLRKGEKLFFEHFSGKLTKLANNLESEFVNTYCKLEGNRANFELAIELSGENKETFDLLLHTDDNNQFALMVILFEVLQDVTERRQHFSKWARAAEEQGKWLASSMLHCWESLCTYTSEASKAKLALDKAESSLKKAQASEVSAYSNDLLRATESQYKFARGLLHLLNGEKFNVDKERATKHLQKSIHCLEESLNINREIFGDHTLTARNLVLLGDCHLRLHHPEKAAEFYHEAYNLKFKLVGSEKHWEIAIYYNQMAHIHERLGREREETWYKRLFGLARKEYKKAVQWMEKALALQVELGVSDTDLTATFQRNLANSHIGLGEYDKALAYAKKSFEIRNANLGKHPETVRILYLIGIIHEWRKDHNAALQSYEEAFAMEESLHEDNHSVVRKLLCDRLEAMCKKLKKKDKLAEYGPRTQSVIEIRSPSASPSEESVDLDHFFRQQRTDDDIACSEILNNVSVKNSDKLAEYGPRTQSVIEIRSPSASPSEENVDLDHCFGQQRTDDDITCSEILINVSVKKSETQGRSNSHEPICASYTVFKKVITSNKAIKITLMSNGCNEEAVSDVELELGYTKVASSKTDVSVEKQAVLKLDASIQLGQHCTPIVKRKWQIGNAQFWTAHVNLCDDPDSSPHEKLRFSLSLRDQSGEPLFEEEHPIYMVPTEWKEMGYGGRSREPSCSSKLTPNFDLTDEQKRWLVVGICLNKTLLPALRVFLKQEMEKHYDDLRGKHSIDKQIHGSHLEKDGKSKLSYKSINNNEAKKNNSHLYDYNVNSAEDLGKLYLMPFMAKFTGFDHTCDLSAILGILSSASVFPADFQDLASEVRSDVRNPSCHCDFLEWDTTKFASCFVSMKNLLKALKLPAEDEKEITDELGQWETKGMDVFEGAIGKPDDLLEFIKIGEEQIYRLLKEVQEEGEQRSKALESLLEALENARNEIFNEIKVLKQQVNRHDKEIKSLQASQNK